MSVIQKWDGVPRLSVLLETPFPGGDAELRRLRRQARLWLGELTICERHPLQWLLVAEIASRLRGVQRLTERQLLKLRGRVILIELRQALRTWVAARK